MHCNLVHFYRNQAFTFFRACSFLSSFQWRSPCGWATYSVLRERGSLQQNRHIWNCGNTKMLITLLLVFHPRFREHILRTVVVISHVTPMFLTAVFRVYCSPSSLSFSNAAILLHSASVQRKFYASDSVYFGTRKYIIIYYVAMVTAGWYIAYPPHQYST